MPHDSRLPQSQELILGNARLVLERGTEIGSLVVRDGRIAEVAPGPRLPRGAVDCEGDLLAPGLVELHTDNLERHLEPRPGVRWPEAQAILAHDAEVAGTGITTVFDALRVGSLVEGVKGEYAAYARPLASEIGRLSAAGHLRVRHRLHLRAETCSETLEAELDVGILSLMDHTPGSRQFRDIGRLRDLSKGRGAMTEAEFEAYVAVRRDLGERNVARHEAAAVAAARRLGAVLASHDDTTPEHVAVSAAHGARIAEFPTTVEAARACRAEGIAVMMGAPNLLRGGSHSGNVAAGELARAGLLDVLSSDYVPASLLTGAVRLGRMLGDLAAGIATVTAAPARAAGLTDRGRLAPGMRADLLRFRLAGDLPVVRAVWVGGGRIG